MGNEIEKHRRRVEEDGIVKVIRVKGRGEGRKGEAGVNLFGSLKLLLSKQALFSHGMQR